MILITGATGQFGSASIDFLLAKGWPASKISALVRNEAKAEALKTKGVAIKVGSYGDYDSLVAAFQRVEKLLLVSSSEVATRSQQHENVVNAAKEAGVTHILYTSFERKNESDTSPIAFVAESHLHTEKLIKESGMAYTLFKNNVYMDFLPMFFGEKVLETGIFLPAGEAKSAFALRSEMAEATANVLLGEGHENKVYSLSNSEEVSMPEYAELLSELTGKAVPYISPSLKEYTEALSQAGVPGEFVGLFGGFAEAIKQGELTRQNTDLEKLLKRKPTTPKAFLSQVYTQEVV